MALTDFRPGPGRFGEEYVTVDAAVGTLTSAGVTTQLMPAVARLCYFKSVSLVASTVAVGTVGATVAVLKNKLGGGTVVLTPETSIFGRTANQAYRLDLAPGVVDADATVREGESLSLRFTNTGGTISTQPVQHSAVIELAVLR